MWILMLAAAVCLQIGVSAAISLLLSVPMEEIALGFGPGFVVMDGPPRLKVGLIPGGYVRFPQNEQGEFVQLSWIQQLLIFPTGPAAVCLAGAVLLGPASALQAMMQLFLDLGLAFQTPSAVREAFGLVTAVYQQDRMEFFGMLLSKVGFFNLLPLATSPVGQLLLRLLPGALKTPITVGSILLVLGLFLAWAVMGIRLLLG